MQSYDPLKVTSHPKLDYVKQIMEGEALSNHQLFNFLEKLGMGPKVRGQDRGSDFHEGLEA